jgi:hypothetical protein
MALKVIALNYSWSNYKKREQVYFSCEAAGHSPSLLHNPDFEISH